LYFVSKVDNFLNIVVVIFPCFGGRKSEKGKLGKKNTERATEKNTFIIASARTHVDVSITFICIFISNRLMLS